MIAFSMATSAPGLNCSMWVAWRLSAWPRGVHDDQRLARLRRLLEVGRGDRVVFRGVGADHDDDVGVLHRGERGRDRARADVFHQRRHRRRVAKAGAVVDIVGAEAGAHQLLDEIGLLVRALGRAEAGERAGARSISDLPKALGGKIQSLVPRGFAEMGERIGGVDVVADLLRHALLSDQRHGQTVGMADIVEAEAALDAEAILVGGAVSPAHIADLVVPDVIGDLAADAAIGADAVDRADRSRRRPPGSRPPWSTASGRRSGRPGRIRRRRRRWIGPSDRPCRRRSSPHCCDRPCR